MCDERGGILVFQVKIFLIKSIQTNRIIRKWQIISKKTGTSGLESKNMIGTEQDVESDTNMIRRI